MRKVGAVEEQQLTVDFSASVELTEDVRGLRLLMAYQEDAYFPR